MIVYIFPFYTSTPQVLNYIHKTVSTVPGSLLTDDERKEFLQSATKTLEKLKQGQESLSANGHSPPKDLEDFREALEKTYIKVYDSWNNRVKEASGSDSKPPKRTVTADTTQQRSNIKDKVNSLLNDIPNREDGEGKEYRGKC
jgi:hypothetical protein